jgi:glycosyltransferase involved in cell wall biosynthesis
MPEIDLEPRATRKSIISGIKTQIAQPRCLKIAMVGQKGIPATYGGIEHHVENLSSGLASLGHKITVFCRPYYCANLDKYPDVIKTGSGSFSYRGLNLRIVKSLKTKHLDAITHATLSTLNAIKDDFDVIHFHGIGPSFVSFIPRLSVKKVVATVHALDFRQKKWGRFAKLCLKMGLKSAMTFPHKTICVSKTILKNLGNGKNLIYIPNGVKEPFMWGGSELDWMRSKGLEPGNYILFVGRLIEDKGCHLLSQAVREIGGGLRLAVAGDSSFTDSYVEKLKQSANPDTVFLGNVYNEKLSALYANCALFVLPSSVEGLPIALIEAMKHKAPVLTSDIPENMEILNNADGSKPVGISFRNKDIKSLKDAIIESLARPDFLHQIAENAIKYVNEKYNWRTIVEKTEQVYFDVLTIRNIRPYTSN